MADDNLNQPTAEAGFNRAILERVQLEQDIKTLLKDLEEANPERIDELAERLVSLQKKRKTIAAS